MTLVYLSLAWLAGIALAALLPDLSPLFWLVPAVISALGWLVGRGSRTIRILFGCGLFLSLGVMRYGLAQRDFGENDLASYNDQGRVTLEGMVLDGSDVRDNRVNLRVGVEEVAVGDGLPRTVSGLALVQAPSIESYAYGSVVRITGELQTPPEYEDFSYRDYLARTGIYSMVRFADVQTSGERRGNPIRRVLLDFRDKSRTTIIRLLPDPQASLLTGILLGLESGIAPSVRDDFNATGATHVIAISGSNLAILAGILRGLTRRWMPPRWSAIVTVLGIFVYSLFVGGDAAVMRAFVMAAVGISGEELFRQTFAPASLSFAALVMTALNPLILWDVGFLLSFLSTWGIVLYSDPIAGGLERLLSTMLPVETAAQIVAATAEMVVVTVAAQITTTPIIALFFGRLSLVSLPVNLLIVPAQGPLMIVGGVAVLLAFVVWPLGQMLTWLAWLFLTYTLAVVRFFASAPYASAEVDVNANVIWAYYGLLFGATFLVAQPPHRKARWREALGQAFGVKAVAAAGIVLSLLLGAVAWSLPDGRLHVYFLDVPGGATLIRTPTGRTVLVDAGSSGRALSTELGDALPFWERDLDLVILTQPVPDAVGGLPSVMTRYRIDTLLTNGQRGANVAADALWSAADEHNVLPQLAQPGMAIQTGDGVTVTMLSSQPPGSELEEDDLGQPVIVMVEYGEARFLLAGDPSQEGESALLEGAWPVGASVLQISSLSSAEVPGEAFLAGVAPQVTVITEGQQPDPVSLERLAATGAAIYQPTRDGTVHIATDGQRLFVWPRQPGR